jgi:hypothetical protein
VPEVHRLIGASVWAVSAPDGAAALVVGRGGGVERALVACLPDADHGSWGHRSATATAPASASIGQFVSIHFRRGTTRSGDSGAKSRVDP